jgi:hypothetical protein
LHGRVGCDQESKGKRISMPSIIVRAVLTNIYKKRDHAMNSAMFLLGNLLAHAKDRAFN